MFSVNDANARLALGSRHPQTHGQPGSAAAAVIVLTEIALTNGHPLPPTPTAVCMGVPQQYFSVFHQKGVTYEKAV